MTTQFPTNASPSTINEYSVSDEENPPPKMISLASQSGAVSTQKNSTILQRLDLTQNQIQTQKRKHSPEKPKPVLVIKQKPSSAIASTSSMGKNYNRNNLFSNAMYLHEFASTNCFPFNHSFMLI